MRRLLIALFLFASPAWAQNFRGTVAVRTHATDCTALTDGTAGQVCVELDSDRFFTCQPTAGGCDTGAEWILTPAAGGGGYATVDEDDTPLTQRTTLNFAGAGITCADDTNQTTCTVPAGSFSSPGAGIIVDTVGDGTLAARTLTAGTGISVANGAGAAGNPTVSVDTATVMQYTSGTGTVPATGAIGTCYAETDTNLFSCYADTDTARTFYSTSDDLNLGGTKTAYGALAVVFPQIATASTTAAQSGYVITNTGDGDGSTNNLLDNPTAGVNYSFAVTVAQTMTIAPASGETLYLNAASCANITSATIGAAASVVAASGGSGAAWIASGSGFTCN